MQKFKRKVFYLAGFDPRGVRFYHQLYREQALVHERHSGEHLIVSGRRAGPGNSALWSVQNEGQQVETDYEYLRWEDLVAKVWIRSPLILAWRSIATYWGHARFMQFRRMQKLRHGPAITILYPPVLGILIPLLIALVVGLPLGLVLPWWVALPVGLAAGVMLSGGRLNKLVVPWLLRFMYFNHCLAANGLGPDLDARVSEFAARVAEQLDDPYDEILLIAHSNGTNLVMTLLGRLLALRGGQLPDHFTVVTLGQVVPVIALRTDATWYHKDIGLLADQRFRLVDFSAPADGAAYFDVNPIALVAEPNGPRIELLSPRFHLFYNPENYNSGWSNKYEAHFDYLRVGDRLSPVDIMGLTASRRMIDESLAAFRTIP